MEFCNICVEPYNKSNLKKVICCFCQFEACRTCCEKYIMDQTTNICCMNPQCNKQWSRQFFRSMFTKVFINTKLKKHTENIFFDQERALLPATQVIIEEMLRKEKINLEMKEIDDKITELYREKNELRQTLNIRIAPRNQVFIRACSDPDCRGFLSSQWKCGLCEKYTCSTCHEVKGERNNDEHVCHPDNIATAALIVNDTKPCPNCRTNIYKIDGCSQIWCTHCNTAFDWVTGNIETTNIHNPHYYEWMRRNNNGRDLPRNPGDLCDGRPLHITHRFPRDIENELLRKGVLRDNNFTSFFENINIITRNLIHMRVVELVKYNFNHFENNQSLRIMFMRNIINEDRFKTLLQQNDKKIQKNLELRTIFQLLIDTSTEILYRILEFLKKYSQTSPRRYDNITSPSRYDNITNVIVAVDQMTNQQTIKEGVENILKEISNISNYANECFAEISKTYDSKKISVNNLLGIIR